MTKATVCAIVLDYFGAEKTKTCLSSLAAQGVATVYVLDNSANSTQTLHLHQALNELRTTIVDYRIEILCTGENLGFGRGVNYVLAHDLGSEKPHDYYLLLNNDAVAGPGLVHGLIAALEKDPQAVLAAPRVVSSDRGREYGIWYHRYLGLLLSRPGRFRFQYFTGCCLLLTRCSVSAGKLFDESFFMYGEDTELGWRLLREGKKTVCADGVYVEHEYGPSVDRASYFYEYHMARSHFLLSRFTYRQPIEIPFLIVAKCLALLSRAVVRSFRHRALTPITACLSAWVPSRHFIR